MNCWRRWQHKGKKKKQSDKEDLYALLGLGNERWTANDNQIKLGQSCFWPCCHYFRASLQPNMSNVRWGLQDVCPECTLHLDAASNMACSIHAFTFACMISC